MRVKYSVQRQLLLLCVLLSASASFAQPARDGVFPHRAAYGLFNGDKRVGESLFTLRYDSTTNHYEFETRSEFRGLLRFAAPKPVIERSEFIIVENQIRPLSFSYQDGTRRGEGNLELRFDWDGAQLIAATAGGKESLALPPATLDRASARVALMRELAASALSESHAIADLNVIRTYENRDEGIGSVATPLGSLTARKISQQRPESSRRTLIWLAPELHFLPIRIEQLRDDRAPVAFVLESVEWLTGAQMRSAP